MVGFVFAVSIYSVSLLGILKIRMQTAFKNVGILMDIVCLCLIVDT